jgi:hypothetical protein
MTKVAKTLAMMLVAVLIPAALLVQSAMAQGPPARGNAEDAFKSSDTDTRAYNKRDFNGLWARNPQAYGLPRCPECADPGPWPPAS